MRTWFTKDNTIGLSDGDLRIINLAVRRYVERDPATDSILSAARTLYRPGMSARDLMDAMEETLDSSSSYEPKWYRTND